MATPSSHDQNLLFGILAFQLDFVTQQQLIDAMQAWMLHKEKTLGKLFVEKGYLTTERQQLLSTLVEEHLRQHGNDAQQSLASIRPPISLCDQLQSLGDARLAQALSIVHTGPSAAGSGDAVFTLPPSSPKPPAPRRFEVLRPLAEGGLGIVLVANDTEVTREVALKEIKPQYADHANSRSRFLQEAEITGRLEHPGIVPVYGLGHYPDGRPFYAMRMIKGRSLQEAIAEFHAKEKAALPPGPRLLALRELLQRFIDVCNAVEYAHSRGIVHRDLKPANVMLGKYRETLVVDWGLAKAIGQTDETIAHDETVIVPELGSDSIPTRMGEVVGTVAFMSPEQAAGRQSDVGAASDIYSLGATLYYLLTGTLSQRDGEIGQLLRNIQHGTFLRPREIKNSIPRPLEAICLKAMARRPADRYPSAAALASDIENYLADEPVLAFPESPWRKGVRWLRKHPRIVGSLAAAVLMGVGGLSLFARQTQIHNAALAVERNEAERARNIAVEVKNVMLEAFQSPDPEKEGRDVTVLEMMNKRAIPEAQHYEGDPQLGAEINRMIGKMLFGVGLYREAIPLFEKAHEFTLRLYGPDHPNTIESMGELCGVHVRAGMAREVLPQMQEVYQRTREQKGPAHEDTLRWMSNLGSAYQEAGQWETGFTLLQEGMEIAVATYGELHPAVASFRNNLAAGYQNADQISKALPYLRQNVELSIEIFGPNNPLTLTAMYNLASGLQAAGKLDDALNEARKVLDLRIKVLSPQHAQTIDAMRLLQGIQLNRRDYTDAEKTIRQWLAELNRQSPRNETEIASARTALAEALLSQQDVRASGRELTRALPILESLAPTPNDMYRARSLRGEVLAHEGKWDEAERALLDSFDRLYERRDDLRAVHRWYISRACERIVDLYRAWDRPAEAAHWSHRLSTVELELEQMRDRGTTADATEDDSAS